MDPPEPRRFQFGIRHLLLAMLIVAALSALIAPWARQFSSGQWVWMGIHAVLAVGTFVTALWLGVLSRRDMERRVGAIQWRVGIRTWGNLATGWFHGFFLIAAATLFLVLLTAMAATQSERRGAKRLEIFQAIYAGWFASVGVLRLRYPVDQMLIGATGVYDGQRFISWDKLWCSCEPGALPVPLLVKTTGWAHELHVPAEIEKQVAEYLLARARPWPNPPRRRR